MAARLQGPDNARAFESYCQTWVKLYADSGYQGAKFRNGLAAACTEVNLEIVKRSDLGRFVVLPRRWIVERTIPPHHG